MGLLQQKEGSEDAALLRIVTFGQLDTFGRQLSKSLQTIHTDEGAQ